MPPRIHLPLLQSLSQFPWFGSLPLAIRKSMLAESSLLRLRPGEILFRKGSPPCGLYALTQGELKISSVSEDGKEGILAILESGIWFGENSMIDAAPHTHDATALSETEVLQLPAPAFQRLLARKEFAHAITQLLAARIRLLYALVEDATVRSTRARIARRLLLLAHGDAALLPGPRRRVPVSQESLAMMLGITPQTLSKDLRRLAQQNVIRLGYGYIEVLAERELKALGEAT